VITKIAYAPYIRAFAQPFAYGNVVATERKGFVVRGEVNGQLFYSEASPLPGHSRESLVDVAAALASLDVNNPVLPCVRFALSTLRAQGRPFHGPLFSNALLPWRGTEETTRLAREFLAAGYPILKLKILEAHLGEQLAFLEAHPDVMFRLDANGALSEPGMLRLFQGIKGLRVDYLEEPRQGNWDSPLLAMAPVSLAADESLDEINLLRAKFPPKVLVVKPMVTGGALPPGRRLVYTTTLETEPGRRALMAWLGEDGTTEVSGLSTGFLFRENYLPDQPSWHALPPIGAGEQAWLDSLAWSEVKG
jgi:hypothetical protein